MADNTVTTDDVMSRQSSHRMEAFTFRIFRLTNTSYVWQSRVVIPRCSRWRQQSWSYLSVLILHLWISVTCWSMSRLLLPLGPEQATH
jgi:hypothetical protein